MNLQGAQIRENRVLCSSQFWFKSGVNRGSLT